MRSRSLYSSNCIHGSPRPEECKVYVYTYVYLYLCINVCMQLQIVSVISFSCLLEVCTYMCLHDQEQGCVCVCVCVC